MMKETEEIVSVCMFMNWSLDIMEISISTYSNIQIQDNPYQIFTNSFLQKQETILNFI